MKDYFSMDSFNRDSTYCCNAISSQTATPHKYVDLEGLKAYDDIAVLSRDISADEVMIDGKTLTQVLKDAGDNIK